MRCPVPPAQGLQPQLERMRTFPSWQKGKSPATKQQIGIGRVSTHILEESFLFICSFSRRMYRYYSFVKILMTSKTTGERGELI